MMYITPMLRFATILTLALSWPAYGQLQPGPEHYAAAANQIAFQRAAAELLEAEKHAKVLAVLRAVIRDVTEQAETELQQRLDAHAARVRAWAGQVGRSRVAAVPGTGWHEVSR